MIFLFFMALLEDPAQTAKAIQTNDFGLINLLINAVNVFISAFLSAFLAIKITQAKIEGKVNLNTRDIAHHERRLDKVETRLNL